MIDFLRSIFIYVLNYDGEEYLDDVYTPDLTRKLYEGGFKIDLFTITGKLVFSSKTYETSYRKRKMLCFADAITKDTQYKGFSGEAIVFPFYHNYHWLDETTEKNINEDVSDILGINTKDLAKIRKLSSRFSPTDEKELESMREISVSELLQKFGYKE